MNALRQRFFRVWPRRSVQWLALLAALLFCLPAHPAGPADRPLFEFGLLADVQYADKAASGLRDYRGSLGRLASTVAALNTQPLAFVAQLGDLLDGNGDRSLADLRAVLGVLTKLQAPVRHVVGNHCLALDRAVLQTELGLESPYYEFRTNGWRFLALDGMDASVKARQGSEEAREAAAYRARDPKLAEYNGAAGARQMRWLRERLADARRARERVIVFIHHPLLEASSEKGLLLWNAREVRQELEASGNVAACFNGHDHRGGYGFQNGVHYVTLAGLVEARGGAGAVVSVYPEQLAVRGLGVEPARLLPLRPWPQPFPDYAGLEAGPWRPRFVPGRTNVTFTMYGGPQDVAALKPVVDFMREQGLGDGFDPGPFALAANQPAFEFLARAGWPLIAYPPRYGEFQIKDGRSRLADADEQALQTFDRLGVFCGIQLGEWGYYFHNLSHAEKWWRDVYGADFETMKPLMKPPGLAGYDHRPADKRECYGVVRDYFLERHRALRGRTVSVTGHSHYEAYAGEWGARMVGLELGENIAYSQSKIAFARGASRQWQVPWSVQVSPWMGPNCTTAGPLTRRDGITFGAGAGHSLSFYRRMWLHCWFAGASLVTPENSFAMFFDSTQPLALSEAGRAAAEVHRFFQSHDRGIPFTPLAVLVDRYAGYNGYMGKPWGILDPTPGDRQLSDLLLRQLYPGRDHIHEGHDPKNTEGTYLMPTPFGEMADVLLTTARAELLSAYPVILLAGDVEPDPALVGALLQALRQGSRLWLLPDQAARFQADLASLQGTGRVELLDEWVHPTTGRTAAAPDDKLRLLAEECLPIQVSGDAIQYQINRNRQGWVVELVNNRGVVKFGDRPASVDPAAQARVQLATRQKIQSVHCWRVTGDSPLEMAPAAVVTVGPGETVFVEFVLASN